MNDSTNERFELLLKAMVQGETPKASNEKRERDPDSRTLRHKRDKPITE